MTCLAAGPDPTRRKQKAALLGLRISRTRHLPLTQLSRTVIDSLQAALRTLKGRVLVEALWKSAPPVPVEANHPLFVIYTSGSTGKPKALDSSLPRLE